MTIRLAPFAFSLRLAPAFALRWRALGALVLGLALGLAARADTEGEFTYTADLPVQDGEVVASALATALVRQAGPRQTAP